MTEPNTQVPLPRNAFHERPRRQRRLAIRLFEEITSTDPASAVLVTLGGLLIGVAVLVFGVLTVGALASLFSST